jgi:hypothetical protein
MKKSEITFHNLTVTIAAKNAKEAYAKLCNALASTNDSDEHRETTEVVGP